MPDTNALSLLAQYRLRHFAQAYDSATQSVPNSSFTIMVYDTVVYDPMGDFTTGASAQYKASVPGYYLVEARASLGASAARMILSIFKNGSEAARGCDMSASSGIPGGSVVDVVQMNAGDFVDIRMNQQQGTAQGTEGGQTVQYMIVQWLSPL